MLWALELEYDGTPLHGLAAAEAWACRPAGDRGGGCAAVRRGNSAGGRASGRTDAGVHALGQMVQMELPEFSPHRLIEALNFHLKPHPIVVLRAAPAPAGWNARFSACQPDLSLCHSEPAGVGRCWRADRVWHVQARLDAAAMHRAARSLLGHHDFSSFRAAACQAKSPMRTLDDLEVTRRGRACDCDTPRRAVFCTIRCATWSGR